MGKRYTSVAVSPPTDDYGGNSFFQGIGQTARDVGRTALQGVTMGWGDEAIARLRSLIGDEDYEELLKLERKALDRFREQNPGTATGLELGAGFYVPGGLFGNLARGSLKGAKGVAKLAGVSGAQGAVYGAGAAEEGDRLRSAGTAAAIASPLGPAMSKSIGKAGDYMSRRFGRGGGQEVQAEHVAGMKVLDAAEDDLTVTNPALAKELGEQGLPATEHMRGVMRDPVTKDRMLADMEGGRMRQLAMGSTARSQRAYEGAEGALGSRLADEATDLSELLSRSMKTTLGGTQRADEIAEHAAQYAGRFYRKAYGGAPSPSGAGPSVMPKAIEVEPFRRFLDNELVEKAYDVVARNLRIKSDTGGPGMSLPPFEKFLESSTTSTKLMHEIKKQLDKRAKWGTRDPAAADDADAARDLIGALNRELGAQNPDYARANAIFSIGPRFQEAVVLGSKAKNLTPSRLKREYKALENDWERGAYRSGLLEELVKPFDKNVTRSLSAAIKQNKSMREKLRATYDDGPAGDKEFNKFLRSVDEQVRYRKTAANSLRTSGTTERQQAVADFRGGASRAVDAVVDVTQVNMTKALQTAANALDSPVVADKVGKLLFTSNRGELISSLNQLMKTHREISGMDRVKIHEIIKAIRRVGGQRRSTGGAAAGAGLLSQQEDDTMIGGLLRGRPFRQ